MLHPPSKACVCPWTSTPPTKCILIGNQIKYIIEPSSTILAGVTTRWHHNLVDIQSLSIEEQLSMQEHIVKHNSQSVVAKIVQFEFEVPLVETKTLVMARFGSEPRFKPEPMQTEPKFSSRFGLQPEPNLRSSSRFRQITICLNLVQTSSNRTKSEQIQGKFHSKFEPNVTVFQLKTGIM